MLNQIISQLGFKPTEETETSILYHSPFNPTEKTPSFYVLKNQHGEFKSFKDFSSGKGGDIYKFLMDYYNIGFKEAKKRLESFLGVEHTNTLPKQNKPPLSSFNQPKKSYEIVKTQPLQNEALLEYLGERGISSEIAKKYLGEIYYKIGDKNYFALSFLNDSGGFEIRNKFFKGSIGKKDVALIKPTKEAKTLKIYEGFIDFLSYLELTKNRKIDAHFLILNSVSLLERVVELCDWAYEKYDLYLDNDKAGDEATQWLFRNMAYLEMTDKREHYEPYKDLNEYYTKLTAN